MPVIAGKPPAAASHPSGMNGMIVTVAMKVALEPSAPRMPNFLFQNPRNNSVPNVHSETPKNQVAPAASSRQSRRDFGNPACGHKAELAPSTPPFRRSPFRAGDDFNPRHHTVSSTSANTVACTSAHQPDTPLLGRPSPDGYFGLFGPCVSSHRTRVRKASQRFVSLKVFNTVETNQRFRVSRAKVPNSNQWIITQPTPRLLTPRAPKGVLSHERLTSSVVNSRTTIHGARA